MGRSDRQQNTHEPKGMDYIFRSGKYEGKSVREVIDGDPNYILYLADKIGFDFDHTVLEAAEEESSTWRP